MSERTLLRVGSAFAVVGAILALVVNALHPRPADFQAETLARLVSESDIWIGIHVGILVAVLLLLGGLVAISRSMAGERPAAWARLGLVSALLGSGVFAVWTASDGIAAKRLADQWASASAAEKAVALRVFDAVGQVDVALFSVATVVLFGATFVLYGVAVALGDEYPKWLGWVAVVGGVGAALVGFVQAYRGPSVLVTNTLFAVFSVALILWVLAIGVLLWRRAGA